MIRRENDPTRISRWQALKNVPYVFWKKQKNRLVRYLWRLTRRLGEKVPTGSNAVPDLCAQTDLTDIDPYDTRLDELLLNRSNSIREIAVTAPYSSGKTSILLTYQGIRPLLNFANISLGAFHSIKSTDDSSNQAIPDIPLSDIEKSILQQLFYRAESHKIPLSRFQRISVHANSASQSYVFAIWATALGLMALPNSINSSWNIQYLLNMSKTDLSVSNPSIWILSFLLAPFVLFIKDAFAYLKPLTITKLNPLKADVELSAQAKENESVFNKHFEEILYFFQVTKTDVVVFEDLDRFGQPDIFVKLKELNGLLNEAGDLKNHPVRFIYALKDDVFQNEERTKFFDAIIPIVPVAHNSNSYPQLKSLCEENGVIDDVSEDLLKDVSFYLHDMRMIKNIVAEYLIYKKILQSTQPDLPLSPLFALIIYKNIYAEDFALLHREKGKVGTFFTNLNTHKENVIQDKLKKVQELDTLLAAAEREVIDDLHIYNVYCIAKFYQHHRFDLRNVGLLDKDSLKTTINNLKSSNEIYTEGRRITFGANNDFKGINPDYKTRKQTILNTYSDTNQKLRAEKAALENLISRVQNSSLTELAEQFPSVMLKPLEEYPLVTLLIRRGYIDEHYHLYLSYFHEGELTKRDMEFVHYIKDRKPANLTLDVIERKLSNPTEVNSFLNLSDYKHVFGVNAQLIDDLLRKGSLLPIQDEILRQISSEESALYSVELLLKLHGLLEEKELWYQCLADHNDELTTRLLNLRVGSQEDLTWDAALVLLISANSSKDRRKRFYQEYEESISFVVNEYPSICVALYEQMGEEVYELLTDWNIELPNVETVRDKKAFVKKGIEHRVLAFTLSNLRVLADITGVSEFSLETDLDYSKLIRTNHVEFEDFLGINIEKLAKFLIDGKLVVSDDNDIFTLIESEETTEEQKTQLIQNLEFTIEDCAVCSLSDAWLHRCLKQDRIAHNWKNVAYFVERWEFDGMLPTILDSWSEKLLQSYDSSDKYESVTNKIIELITNQQLSANLAFNYVMKLDIHLDSHLLNHLEEELIKLLVASDYWSLTQESYDELAQFNPHYLKQWLLKHLTHNADSLKACVKLSFSSNVLSELIHSDQLSDPQCYALVRAKVESLDISMCNNRVIKLLAHGVEGEPPINVPARLLEDIFTIETSTAVKIELLKGSIGSLYLDDLKRLVSLIDNFGVLKDDVDEFFIPMTKENSELLDILKAKNIIQRFTSLTPEGTEDDIQGSKFRVIVREHTDSTATN